MIIDCFMVCHELDLLEVRMRILYDYVDRFVILESIYDHTGKEKPLYFDLNKDRFVWAYDKIVHLVDRREQPFREHDLTLEMFQRQYLIDEARKLCTPQDIILISDVDEFPSREAISDLRNGLYDGPLRNTPLVMKQDLYYYNIHCPRNKLWLGTVVMRGAQQAGTIKTIRDNRYSYPILETGWHFSYFMNPADIALKLASFAHNNTAVPPFIEKDYLLNHIKNNTNFLNKADGDVEPKPLPDYILSEMKRYPVFMGVYE